MSDVSDADADDELEDDEFDDDEDDLDDAVEDDEVDYNRVVGGVPKSVLERAKEILGNLEESELTPEGNVRQQARHRAERERLQQLGPPPQLDLFG